MCEELTPPNYCNDWIWKITAINWDAVLIEYMKPEELRKGDILVFNREGIIITHRIVDITKKKDKYYFTTQGDANPKPDGFISTDENVIGKVDYVVKYIGFPTVLINELFERS